MIRSGEGRGGGRPGRGREGKEREGKGGVRRRPGLCASARRLPGLLAAPRPAPAPASAPAPTAARGARAASAPPPPEPRASASCARSPARAEGWGEGGGRALRPRGDPGSPPPGAPAEGSHLHPRGARRPLEGGPGAHGRAFQLFFEGLACPPRRKMPTEAAAGVGKRPPPRFRHLRNSGRFARIWDAPAADTLIKYCLSIFAATNANDQILCMEPS